MNVNDILERKLANIFMIYRTCPVQARYTLYVSPRCN